MRSYTLILACLAFVAFTASTPLDSELENNITEFDETESEDFEVGELLDDDSELAEVQEGEARILRLPAKYTLAQRKCIRRLAKSDKSKATIKSIVKCKKDFSKKKGASRWGKHGGKHGGKKGGKNAAKKAANRAAKKEYKKGYAVCIKAIPQLKSCFA